MLRTNCFMNWGSCRARKRACSANVSCNSASEIAGIAPLDPIDGEAQLWRLAEQFKRLVGGLRIATSNFDRLVAPSSSQPLREATFLNVNLTVYFGKVIGITWSIPAEINDAKLGKQLFTLPGFYEGPKRTGSRRLTPCMRRKKGTHSAR
jgi:hypothetical protein